MSALHVLHLRDDRPGHYHLAQGVIAALERLTTVDIQELEIARKRLVPGRFLRWLETGERCAPETLLRIGYGLDASRLKPTDLIISSGGETLPGNLASARILGAENIFIGSRRNVPVERFSLIVSSYERHRSLPRHLVTLKPSALDPDALGRPGDVPAFGPSNPPKLAGLLVGGDSGLFNYRDEEWHRVLGFARDISRVWGTRWLVSTSRRTPPSVAQAAFDLAKDKTTVADFVDYKLAGPGSLEKIFARADLIVCSEDSSTMISEAVWCRLPVIGVSPECHAFKPEEAEYRRMMVDKDWCRFLPISGLSVEGFGAALEEIRVIDINPSTDLAARLHSALPQLLQA